MSDGNFENSITNLIVVVTEIKGDIKLILHQIATTTEVQKDHGTRIESLEKAVAEAVTVKKLIKGALAFLAALVTIAGTLYGFFH